jgi:SOS-response transcriptional repressor LexA
MSGFGKRLASLRERTSLSQKALAKIARVSQVTIWKAENADENNMQGGTLEAICSAIAAKLNMATDEVRDFLLGPLPGLKDQIKQIESKPPSPEWQHAQLGPPAQELPDIPIVSQVPAGPISRPTEPTKVVGTIPRGCFPFDPQAFALEVHGDSMAPWVNDRDLVIASPAVAWGDEGFPEGMCCVVMMRQPGGEHRECLKCVYRHGEGKLRLVPRNDAYPTQVVDSADVTVVPIVARYFRDWLRLGVKIPVVPGRGEAGGVQFVTPGDAPQRMPDYDAPQEHPDYDGPLKVDPVKANTVKKTGRPRR